MRIIEWEKLISSRQPRPIRAAVTIGVFDGLHLGHRQLLDAILMHNTDTMAVVFTFRNNPVQVLQPEKFNGNITNYTQKVRNFQLYGVDVLVSIDFSLEFSKISGKDFLEVLSRRFDIQKLVIGQNFHFGAGGQVGVGDLPALLPASRIEVIKPVSYQGKRISSTWVRQLIKAGEFGQANELLYREYTVEVIRIEVEQDFLRLYPQPDQVLPGDGVYYVQLAVNGFRQSTLINIEKRIIRLQQLDMRYEKHIEQIIFIEKRHERS